MRSVRRDTLGEAKRGAAVLTAETKSSPGTERTRLQDGLTANRPHGRNSRPRLYDVYVGFLLHGVGEGRLGAFALNNCWKCAVAEAGYWSTCTAVAYQPPVSTKTLSLPLTVEVGIVVFRAIRLPCLS